jgi:hypothetical protein
MTIFKLVTPLVLLISIQACSQQQVISITVTVAKLPVKAVGAVAGATGSVVGGAAGGLVAGRTGRKYGSMAGQSAARRALP